MTNRTLRAALAITVAVLGVGLARTAAAQGDPKGVCVDPRGCGTSSGSGSGGTSSSGDIFHYPKALVRKLLGKNDAGSANAQPDSAQILNGKGVDNYLREDWPTAAYYFARAQEFAPDDSVIRQNLVNAKANMAISAEAYAAAERRRLASERAAAERQRLDSLAAAERQRQNKAAVDKVRQSLQGFAQTLNAAPVAGGLDFDGRTAGGVAGGKSSTLDFTAAIAAPSGASPGSALSWRDDLTVDTRNNPLGLPKAADDAISAAYAHAPPGVSDRVRKGFQAVQARDWAVAKAWFEDALRLDPENIGLKHFVALVGTPQLPGNPAVPVDARNEPAGLGGSTNSSDAAVLNRRMQQLSKEMMDVLLGRPAVKAPPT